MSKNIYFIMKKRIIIFITLLLLFNIILKYKLVIGSIYNITNLFIKNIFPPLFLMFIISSILINYGFIDTINNMFGKLFYKLFKIDKYSSYIFIMSILSGLPSNAKYTKELLDKNLINETEAEKILLFSHFANPIFILSIVKYKPYLVIFATYISNIIIGLLFRNYGNTKKKKHKEEKTSNNSIINVLTNSIIESFNILIIVFGLIICFNTISLISNNNILKYILEMSSSINYIYLFNLTDKYKCILITGILSFGGICIHMQVYSILYKTKIRYEPYLLARIIHFILSTLIIYILY